MGTATAVLFYILVIFSTAYSRIITLDVESDQSSEFLDITCHYADSYTDFWVFGCAADPSSANDGIVGFWTACGKSCHFIYNTGILPRPLKISVEGYLGSPATVAIEGSRSVYNTTDWTDIGKIEEPGWFKYDVDMGAIDDSHVFAFSLIPFTGLALIDKIVIDLGRETPDPTTVPPITNPPHNGWLKLDKLNDHSEYYTDMCHFSVGFEDFGNAWGCPTVVEEISEFESHGFWSSCQRENCRIKYYGRIDGRPLNIQLIGHINGGAFIRVLGGPSTLIEGDHLYTIDAGSTALCNSIEGIDLELFGNIHAVTIELVSAPNGFVLLDGLVIQLEGSTGPAPEFNSSIQGDISCRVVKEKLSTTTTRPTVTTTPATATTTSTTETPSGAGYQRVFSWLILCAPLLTSSLLK